MFDRHARLGQVVFVLTSIAILASAGCGDIKLPERTVRNPSLVLDHYWQNRIAERDVWSFVSFEYGKLGLTPHGLLLAGTGDGTLIAVEPGTGEEVWSYTSKEGFEAEPVFHENWMLIGGMDGVMRALDYRTGEEIWTYESNGSIQSAAAIGEEIVFFSNALHQIFALDLREGTYLWRKERKVTNDFTIYGHGGPLYHEGFVFVGFADGQVMAYAAEDGATFWGRDLSGDARRFKDVDATPIFAEGSIIVSSFAGGLYALNPASGEVVWQREIEGASQTRFEDGLLFFSSREGVHAADTFTGYDLWRFPISEDDIGSVPVLTERLAIVSLAKDGLLILEKNTGNFVLQTSTGSGVHITCSAER